MKVLDHVRALEELAKSTNKWCIYIHISHNNKVEETFKAAPYLNAKENIQLLADGSGYILCDSKEEMEALFELTVGDDGPTKTNSYNGPAKVYVLTCNPTGQPLNENT